MSRSDVNSVKTADLVKVFADHEGRLRRLIEAGKITEAAGRVGLVEAVQAFLADLRAELAENTATKSAELAREARADASSLRLAERKRELIPVDEADAAVTHVAGAINSAITQIPARATRDVRDRRKLDELIFALRERIAGSVGGASR